MVYVFVYVVFVVYLFMLFVVGSFQSVSLKFEFSNVMSNLGCCMGHFGSCLGFLDFHAFSMIF